MYLLGQLEIVVIVGAKLMFTHTPEQIVREQFKKNLPLQKSLSRLLKNFFAGLVPVSQIFMIENIAPGSTRSRVMISVNKIMTTTVAQAIMLKKNEFA
jgi:hypothetical protein